MIHSIYIGIGSNINREKNILAAINNLKESFGELTLSSVYESAPIDLPIETNKPNNYFNLVGAYETSLSPYQVNKLLKKIEKEFGRRRKNHCPLDLDLLLYDNLIEHNDNLDHKLDIPGKDIIDYAHVAIPLAEINGDRIHPETGKSFHQHSQLKHIVDQKINLTNFHEGKDNVKKMV